MIKKMFNALDDKLMNIALEEALLREDLDETSSPSAKQHFDFDDYYLNETHEPANINLELQDYSDKDLDLKFTNPCKLSEDEFQNLFEKLNQDQRDYVMHVANHFDSSDQQLFHFVTGGAGVGKSLVIQTLFQTLLKSFNKDPTENPDEIKILLCAPTDKASYKIKGQTLHSTFRLPVNQKHLTQLSPSVSNTLTCALGSVKLLIIDEISMVGQHTLQMVNERLQHIKGNKLPFGGVCHCSGRLFSTSTCVCKSIISPTTRKSLC